MIKFNMIRNSQGNIEHIETNITGHQLLTTAKLNKHTAFSQEEREDFELTGRLPPSYETIEEQASRYYKQYLTQGSDINKHVYLNNLHNHNETLFFKLISDHLEEMLPVSYTPTIGEAVKRFSLELRQQRGLIIPYTEKNNIEVILDHRLNDEVDLIVVTDGERVLGIGDQGIGGLNISVGKLMVYTVCAHVNPHKVLPIQLDLGTNNKTLLNDPHYLGLKIPRVNETEYDVFIDAFIMAVKKKFPNVLLHWEDFGKNNARKYLDRYKDTLCSFNDDIQGTAVVTASAILSAVKHLDQKLSDQRFVFFGAGSAATGIVDQIVNFFYQEGFSNQEAMDRIWMIGSSGLLFDDTKLHNFQIGYAKNRNQTVNWELDNNKEIKLYDVVRNVRPTVLIGCSTVHGAFEKHIIEEMARNTENPIIFPLSNPTEKSEAIPDDLIEWTKGKALIATGSPFNPVSYNGKLIPISQCNNALVFPGIGLGAIAVKAKKITDNMLNVACSILTNNSPILHKQSLALLPGWEHVLTVSYHVAIAVAKQAIKDGVANQCDIGKEINKITWKPEYYRYFKI